MCRTLIKFVKKVIKCKCLKELIRLMIAFRIAIDGGKDSLSVSVKHKKYDIDSP